MSDLQLPGGDETFGEHLVENLFATWVDRDLEQRATGLTRALVYRAVVELPPSGGEPIVRINEEVSLQARAVASAPIKKGDPVTAENGREERTGDRCDLPHEFGANRGS